VTDPVVSLAQAEAIKILKNFREKFAAENFVPRWREWELHYIRTIHEGAKKVEKIVGTQTPYWAAIWQRDLYWLAKYGLGLHLMSFRLHYPLCQFVQLPGITHKLYLLPRGWFKTRVITIADSVRLILRDPNVALLIATGTAKVVREFTEEVKTHFQRNMTLRALFPEYCPPAGKEWGSQDMFTMPNKTALNAEPTWRAASTGSNLTGLHPDRIKFDDLVDVEMARSRTELEKCWEWYQMAQMLPKTKQRAPQDVIGTRYHNEDIYGRIEKADMVEDGGKFAMWRVTATVGDVPLADGGQSAFPEQITTEELWRMRNGSGKHPDPTTVATFESQMMQNPVPAENTVPREKIQYHTDKEEELHLQNLYLDVDASLGKSATADYCAFVVWGATANEELHCHEAYRGYMLQDEFIEEIFKIIEKYKKYGGLKAVTIQKAIIETVYRDTLERELARRRVQVTIHGSRVHGAGRGKPERIYRIVEKILAGKAKLCRGMIDFENELVFGEREGHDDICDAASDVVEVAVYPKGAVPVTVPVEDVPKFTPEYLAKARDEMYREMFAEQRKNAGEAERLAIAGEIG
jgi:hypothetical protein